MGKYGNMYSGKGVKACAVGQIVQISSTDDENTMGIPVKHKERTIQCLDEKKNSKTKDFESKSKTSIEGLRW